MQANPTKDRLVTVDALRGFALLGIMLAHFIFWYTAGPLPEDVFGKYKDLASQLVNIFNNLFITGKFFAFFSFLFAGMVVFFISGLTLLMFKKAGQAFFFPMAPVGKMALSSYITQTLFGLILFYGIGFHLYTKTSPALNYLIAIAFFICQMFFSKWWLQYFKYGPLEWLWRSGTLLKWQPMLKQRKEPLPLAIPAGDGVTS